MSAGWPAGSGLDDRGRLVYVMGRGHSGSTVLDAILGSADGVQGVGELVAGLGRDEGRCSCGRLIRECEFWGRVRERYESGRGARRGGWRRAVESTRSQAHLRRYLRTLVADDEDPELVELAGITSELVRAIAEVASSEVVVDSSKEISRALFLARFVPATRIIHLVRDPVRVAASTLDRVRGGSGFAFLRRRYESRPAEPFFMTLSAAGWLVGNLMAEVVRLRGSVDVLRVSFEDLCESPRRELERIGDFLDSDLTGVADRVTRKEPLRIEHVIAGNRMRHRDSFVFEPERAAGRHLPWYYVALVRVVTWPLVIAYRLLGRSRAGEPVTP